MITHGTGWCCVAGVALVLALTISVGSSSATPSMAPEDLEGCVQCSTASCLSPSYHRTNTEGTWVNSRVSDGGSHFGAHNCHEGSCKSHQDCQETLSAGEIQQLWNAIQGAAEQDLQRLAAAHSPYVFVNVARQAVQVECRQGQVVAHLPISERQLALLTTARSRLAE